MVVAAPDTFVRDTPRVAVEPAATLCDSEVKRTAGLFAPSLSAIVIVSFDAEPAIACVGAPIVRIRVSATSKSASSTRAMSNVAVVEPAGMTTVVGTDE